MMELNGISWLMVGTMLLAGVVLGFLIGRRSSAARARARQLEGDLEELRKEHEHAQAEVEAVRENLDRYRGKVADHFAGTSERLRDLTLQYRAVYSHLAEGAVELCPEGFEKLEGGLGLDAIPEESETPESDPN